MACPQCELGGLRCDDAMLSVRHQLGTQEPPANSRHGRQAEWNQKCRIWNRVGMLPSEAPRCVHGSVDTEARINRAWIQLAHGMRAAATEESSATQKRATMNPRHRLSALTMLALMTPVLAAGDTAHAEAPKPADDQPAQEVATKEPASSYIASLTGFQYQPTYPVEPTYPEGIIRDTPAIIMPIQPYPISPPLPDMTCLKPRRRKSRTPWRKAERGW